VRVGVLVFDGVEELDFVGPWEVLSYANKLRPGSLQMYLVGTHSPIQAFNKLRVLPDVTLADCPQLDILVLPGGKGRLREMKNPDILQFIRQQYPGLSWLTSVCTGAFFLAEARLLQGRRATTHFSAIEELAGYPGIDVQRERVVQDGKILCAAGVASGLDLGLYLLETLFGNDLADQVATNIEYRRT
jgi:cyclohexyl-isocyanide hydratase